MNHGSRDKQQDMCHCPVWNQVQQVLQLLYSLLSGHFFYFSSLRDGDSTLVGVEVLELLLHTEEDEQAEMEDDEDVDPSESRGFFLVEISSPCEGKDL